MFASEQTWNTPDNPTVFVKGLIICKIRFTNSLYQCFVSLAHQWTQQGWEKSVFYCSVSLAPLFKKQVLKHPVLEKQPFVTSQKAVEEEVLDYALTQVILFLIWEMENAMSTSISGQVCLNIKKKSYKISCYYVKIPHYNVKLLLFYKRVISFISMTWQQYTSVIVCHHEHQ